MSTSHDRAEAPGERGLTADEIDLLRRRAARYARRAKDEDITTEEVVLFTRGGASYAVVLRLLREIRPLKKLTLIPSAPRAVPGVFHYRGDILSAHDLGASRA